VRVLNLKEEDLVSAVALVVDTGEDGGEEILPPTSTDGPPSGDRPDSAEPDSGE
jgi:hypothetical protein